MLSFSTREVEDVGSGRSSQENTKISVDEKAQESDNMAGLEIIKDRTLSVPDDAETGGGISPSTYEIEVGTLPAGFNEDKTVQSYGSEASSKRGPETQSPADLDETVPLKT